MKLLDSSVWIAHLVEANKSASEIIESDSLLSTSILTLFEVKKKLLKENISKSKIDSVISLINERSLILGVNEEIVNSAAEISFEQNLSSLDSLIYASAMQIKAKFITADNDFRNLDNVEIIDNRNIN